MAQRDLSIVIPVKNEGNGLTITLEMLVLFVDSLREIIVVAEDISDKSYGKNSVIVKFLQKVRNRIFQHLTVRILRDSHLFSDSYK